MSKLKSKRLPWLLSPIIVLVPFLWGEAVRAAPSLVNGVAATLGNKVVTLQAADFHRAVQLYREGNPAPLSSQSLEERKKTVQKAALEEMVFLEMKSFRYGASQKAEAERILKMRRANDKANVFKKIQSQFGKSEADIVNALARSLEVEKFLQTKIETLTPVITDAEVERYYRQNASRYPGGDLESNRAQITRELKFDKMQRALEEWVQSLREKYRFVNLLNNLSEKKG